MTGWLALALVAWLVAVVFICAMLTAAKRADAAAAAQAAPVPPPLPLVALERLAHDVRRELAVDQVLIVIRDERAPGRAVAVAGAGVSPSVLGASLLAHDSVAAAVAESGQSAIAAGHGPLDRPHAAHDATGDAAAVALAVPAGALAVARLDPAQPLTSLDLQHLRALLRRRGSRFRRPRMPQRASGAPHRAVTRSTAETARPVATDSTRAACSAPSRDQRRIDDECRRAAGQRDPSRLLALAS